MDSIKETKDFVRKVAIRGKRQRQARIGRFQVRVSRVVLDMVEAFSGEQLELPVSVVDVREAGTTPRGEEATHWRLLTNRPIRTSQDADAAIDGYSQRWRIEELHRAWKSGVCRVEESKLRFH